MTTVENRADRFWDNHLALLRTAIGLLLVLIVVVIGAAVHLDSRIGEVEYAVDAVGQGIDAVSAKMDR